MPNFKCKSVKELSLPFEAKGVCFEWLAQNERTRLIYTAVEQGSFFVQVGQNAKNEFIIKGEKHSKPEQIGLLQKALLVFKENFCDEILNEAFALKHTRLLTQSAYIQNDISTLSAKFKDFDKVFLEIGFGSGRHLLWQARTNPDTLIIGVEIYTPAIEQVAKLAQKECLNNVFLVKSDARLLLSVLNSNSLAKIFLHFPVPWDKQAGRRVVSELFAKECLRVLKKGGSFELRTDSVEYFEFSKEIFASFENIKIQLAKNENLDISSKYETRWKKQEKDIYDLRVICEQTSKDLDENLDFNIKKISFKAGKLDKMQENFSKRHFKGEDFFICLENFYRINKEKSLLKITFGAFNKPEHAYLLLGQKSKFLFKEPFKTKENQKALIKLQEFFAFE